MPEINAKQAVTAAITFFKMLYEGATYFDLLVEEIELAGPAWHITLGYSRPQSAVAALTGAPPNR